MVADNIQVNLLIKPSEFDLIMGILEVFRKKDSLKYEVPASNQKFNDDIYKKLVNPNLPLTPEELVNFVEESEKSEKVDLEGFKKALGI